MRMVDYVEANRRLFKYYKGEIRHRLIHALDIGRIDIMETSEMNKEKYLGTVVINNIEIREFESEEELKKWVADFRKNVLGRNETMENLEREVEKLYGLVSPVNDENVDYENVKESVKMVRALARTVEHDVLYEQIGEASERAEGDKGR